MEAISNEIREKIIKHKQNGAKEQDIATWLIISPSSVTRIWGLFKCTGSWLPKEKTQGRKNALSNEVQAAVIDKIKEQPDITLNELIELFELKISESGLSKKLKKLGFSFKKRQLILRNKTERRFKLNAKSG
jgi:transposase